MLGKNIFRRESGIAVERYYKMPELAKELELFEPSWFAGETEIVLGKKSGKYSILYQLRKKGINATDEQVSKILALVKQKSIEKKELVSDGEFDIIVSNTLPKSAGNNSTAAG